MKIENTYFIERNGFNIWLAQGIEPLETDTVIETRPMMLADEGKVLKDKDGNMFNAIWIKDNSKEYIEVDEPVEEEEDADLHIEG